MSIECFVQRLLNPYRGVMHTIRYAAAEAVTLDGAHFQNSMHAIGCHNLNLP